MALEFVLRPRFIFLVVLVATVALVVWLDRENIERHSFLFFRRTKRGVEKIHAVAKRFPRFWNGYAWLGVVAGIVSMVGVTYWMGRMGVQMLAQQSAQGGPSLVLPGLVSQNQFNPGVSFVPIEYWVIAIGVLMFVHEMSHGIVASNEGFEINSVGWLILGIIPGAFVEPKGEQMLPGGDEDKDDEDDEEEEILAGDGAWEQGNWRSRLKVLAAGSWANYVTAAVFLLLGAGLASAVSAPGDVVYSAQDNWSAKEAGLDNGTLYGINGKKITSREQILNITKSKEPGEKLDLWTSEKNVTVELGNRTGYDGGYIGIRVGQRTSVKQQFKPLETPLSWLVSLLLTIGALNVGIGLFNMVPVRPLDGGQMLDTLVERFLPGYERWANAWHLVGVSAILLMVLAAIIGPML